MRFYLCSLMRFYLCSFRWEALVMGKNAVNLSMRCFKFCLVLVVLVFTPVWANDSAILVNSKVNWQTQTIVFELSTAVDQRGLPTSKQRAEGLIDRMRFRMIADSLGEVVFNSQGSFVAQRHTGNRVIWNLDEVATLARKEHSVFSSDFKTLSIAYTLNFSDITKHITATSPRKVTPLLHPTVGEFDYTGIVIYAAQPLPVRNGSGVALLQPALSPAIIGADGDVLFSIETMDVAAFRRQGTVTYTHSALIKDWPVTRVGFNPLVISATAVSGDFPTDIVLSSREMRRLRGTPAALDLFYQGRVLVIIQPPGETSN